MHVKTLQSFSDLVITHRTMSALSGLQVTIRTP